MNWDETSSAGVHLRGQTGQEAIIDFDNLLMALPPALRSAFEAERTARQNELESIIAETGYNT